MPLAINTWGTCLGYRCCSPRESDGISPGQINHKAGRMFHNSLPLGNLFSRYQTSLGIPAPPVIYHYCHQCHCSFLPSSPLLQRLSRVSQWCSLPTFFHQRHRIFCSTSLLPPSLRSQLLCHLSSWKGLSRWIHVKASNWKWLNALRSPQIFHNK